MTPARRRTTPILAALAVTTAACTPGEPQHADAARGDATAPAVTGAASPCGPWAAGAGDTGVTAIRVNRGSRGMASRVRWATSPDRCALLVVEDPAAVEAEPVPNGFVFAGERGPRLVQHDSVWDVAPSPDWSRLAYGRAYTLLGGGRDSIPRTEWAALARRVGLGAEAVRRGAFPSSGMAVAYGVARPVIVDVATRPTGVLASGRALPTTGGWRVAWTRDGGAVVLGEAPRSARDDAPPTRWRVVDAGTPAARSATERARSLDADVSRAEVSWREGPTLDVSVGVDTVRGAPIAVDGGSVESRDGVISLFSARGGRVVGPGVALAATRSGRFIAAVVPDSARGGFEPPVRLVVYRVGWRPGGR
jgi:hypothetical protein